MAISSNIEYIQADQFEATSFVKNSKAFGFVWCIFSVCFALISIVVFIQPQWIGSDSIGYFGLWRHCRIVSFFSEFSSTAEFICHGRLDDFSSILNPSFRSATALVGVGTIISLLSVFALILFVCSPTRVAFNIISWMQAVAAFFHIVGLLVFPTGWDAKEINDMCSNDAIKFNLGSNCGLRWAYVLAIMNSFDGIVLAILGFVLGSHQIKLRGEDNYTSRSKLRMHSSATSSRGFYHIPTTTDDSTTYSSTKKSMNIQPIFVLPTPTETDRQASTLGPKETLYKGQYATTNQLFQL